MYQRIENSEAMHINDASVKYPDKYILMSFPVMPEYTGRVEYIGDNYNELLKVRREVGDLALWCVIEGRQLQFSFGCMDLCLK
jgi:hypothetical protein